MDAPAATKTLCGRAVPEGAALAEAYEFNEKTCESCLRLVEIGCLDTLVYWMLRSWHIICIRRRRIVKP